MKKKLLLAALTILFLPENSISGFIASKSFDKKMSLLRWCWACWLTFAEIKSLLSLVKYFFMLLAIILLVIIPITIMMIVTMKIN